MILICHAVYNKCAKQAKRDTTQLGHYKGPNSGLATEPCPDFSPWLRFVWRNKTQIHQDTFYFLATIISLRENYLCSFPLSVSTSILCIQRWPSCPKNVHRKGNQAWHSSITVRHQIMNQSGRTPSTVLTRVSKLLYWKRLPFAALRNGSMLCLLYQTVQCWSG